MGRILRVSTVVVLAASAPSVGGRVEGRIVRVGLFAGASPVVRSGNWSFVEVDLRWSGEQAFDGELRVDQPDRDGDVVTSVLKVPLAPDGQWHRYQVYFVPNNVGNNDRLRVKLFNERGQLVKMLDENGAKATELVSAPICDLPADELLIVDLTVPRKLAHIDCLDRDATNRHGWVNARIVRRMSPRELPSRWHGLEAVDAIAWDNADPSALSGQQIMALIDWIKAGGRLLITGGTNWQALSSSALADALPVTITGVRQVTEAQEFTDIVKNDDYAVKLDRHYSKNPITRCWMSPLPIALPIPAECPNPQIAYRRLLGRGLVTFVGASLHELLPVPSRIARPMQGEPLDESASRSNAPDLRVWEAVIGRGFLALAAERSEETSVWGRGPENLFRKVRRSIAFSSLSAAFLIFAILFAIAYTLVATFGSYWYLKRRGWQHQCWSAFALVGVAGSVVGTGMVWTLRGVTTKVWQTTVVDGQSGLDYGYAMCLFGVKTPDHTRLALRLPVGAEDDAAGRRFGPLRAMPEARPTGVTESGFVAPENYRFDVQRAQLFDVPVRATLKEFQGAWHGPLGGTLDAKLVARRTDDPGGVSYEFAGGSYIRNNLGVDLRDCQIIETPDEVALRASGVRCWDLGDLPKSGSGSVLEGEQIRQRLFHERKRGSDAADLSPRIKRWPRLDEQIQDWTRRLPSAWTSAGDPLGGAAWGADQEQAALLLLSVFDLVESDPKKQRVLRRSHGRTLDCTHQLTRRTAILIGWSDDPPPAVLQINRTSYRPDKSRTMYRFVIPVDRRSGD